jgi:hypothetical protein
MNGAASHEARVARAGLPPADRGDLDRAIEIAIVKHTPGGQIETEHHAGVTRPSGLVRVIGELRI